MVFDVRGAKMQSKDKPGNLGKIVRLKLSEQVLERLRNMIVSGELKSGDKVPSERTLMERFGVGRPAVREALQSLHTQGLITITHGERSRVNELSAQTVLNQSDDVARLLLAAAPANLEHLKEARRMFELGIVRAAAAKANDDDIATLRAFLREQEGHLQNSKSIKLFIEADMRFHTAIAEILDNPVITAVSGAMLGWLLEYHTSLLHWSGHEQITLNEHNQIIDALAANDPTTAVAAMESHLSRSQTLYNSKLAGA
jgi:GntR family transcriptional regulator, sialic acid-inducible nan operon repressor